MNISHIHKSPVNTKFNEYKFNETLTISGCENKRKHNHN